MLPLLSFVVFDRHSVSRWKVWFVLQFASRKSNVCACLRVLQGFCTTVTACATFAYVPRMNLFVGMFVGHNRAKER
jgi:hypothetical protein